MNSSKVDSKRPVQPNRLGKRKRKLEQDTPCKRIGITPPSGEMVAPAQQVELPVYEGLAPQLTKWRIPNELLGHIFNYLDAPTLLNAEKVPGLEDLAMRAIKAACGPEPLPRVPKGPSDFRALAIERHAFREKRTTDLAALADTLPDVLQEQTIRLAKTVVSNLLYSPNYADTDKQLYKVAVTSLMKLQDGPNRNSNAWNEGVATALMAQRRYHQAAVYYARISANNNPLHVDTWLTAARFGWYMPPLPDKLPRIVGRSVREQMAIGCAARGNLHLLRSLHAAGVAMDACHHNQRVGTAAAINGHVHILQFLHDNGVDVLNDNWDPEDAEDDEEPEAYFSSTPLWVAAHHGRTQVAEFLLGLGGNPDKRQGGGLEFGTGRYYSPAEVAVESGHLDVLRAFVQHMPGLASSHTGMGDLRVAPLFADAGEATVPDRIRMLAYYVKEAGVDINAKDRRGRSALHLAADYGDLNLFQAVVALGADIHALDDTGKSAAMSAESSGNKDLVDWLRGQTS